MPLAQSRLELLQVQKLLQLVDQKDQLRLSRLLVKGHGVPDLVNLSEPKEGQAALHLAAFSNDEDVIKLILSYGAYPDVRDFQGRTPMMRACEFGHVQALQALLDADADPSVKDVEGKSALAYCLCPTNRHLKCLSLILEAGAEINSETNDGKTTLLLACKDAEANAEICILLIDNWAKVNAVEKTSGETPLLAACASASSRVVEALLRRGADPDQADRRGSRPAHRAAKVGSFEILMHLSAFGAKFDKCDIEMKSPIHWATELNFPLCVRFLGQRGCDPRTKDRRGNIPKVVAKDNGFKEVLKELKKLERIFNRISKGLPPPSDPRLVRIYDWLQENHDQVLTECKILDTNATNFITVSEFRLVMERTEWPPMDEKTLLEILNKFDKNKNGMIDYNSFLTGKGLIHKTYLKGAYDPNKVGKKKKGKSSSAKGGKSKGGKATKVPMPVCFAPEGPRRDQGEPPEPFVPQFTYFTDPKRFDREHPPRHPLQDDSQWYMAKPDTTYINMNDAAKLGDLETIRHALELDYAVDTRDKFFKTPLMSACAAGNFNMVVYLLNEGAKVNARDNFLWTPLHHAAHTAQIDIVKLLLSCGANLNAPALNGATPLMRGIESGKAEIVKFLLERNAKVDVENRKGQTVADLAETWGNTEIVAMVEEAMKTLPPTDKDKNKRRRRSMIGGSTVGRQRERPQTVPPLLLQDQSKVDPEEIKRRRNMKNSKILRAASALSGGRDYEKCFYSTPRPDSSRRIPSQTQLMQDREERRQRFSWQVDFDDFQMPFSQNVAEIIKKLREQDPDLFL